MKLTVIGGGGVRSMFLAKSIAQRAEELHIDELVFMDNDPEKLRIYGGLAAHVARMLCPTMKFTLTSSAEEAVTDADYVITTIRVGGDATRVRDERLALDLGILGQLVGLHINFDTGFSSAAMANGRITQFHNLIRANIYAFICSGNERFVIR